MIDPLVYCSSDEKDFSCTTNFYPAAASADKSDYSPVHFYAVTDKFIEAIYIKGNSRFDFPLKLWPDEKKIIEKGQETSVLLLGQSGTGKTTCCLYLLWNQLQDYWKQEKRFDCDINADKASENADASEKVYGFGITVDGETPLSVLTSEKYCEPKGSGHLRQIFVTKNNLLCDAVRKKFYDLCAPHDYLSQHLKYEEQSTPLSELFDAQSHQYPLFLSFINFLLLLDRTLPGDSFFWYKGSKKIQNSEY